MDEGIETIAGKERVAEIAEIPGEEASNGAAPEAQATAEGTENVEPADPEFLREVVVGLIEGRQGRTHVKEIVYALTLKRNVPKSLFNVIRRELKTIEEAGAIVHVGRGKYQPPGAPLPPKKRTSGKPAQTAKPAAPKPQRRPNRRPSREKQEELEEKMRGAFDETYHVVPPRKTRGRRKQK